MPTVTASSTFDRKPVIAIDYDDVLMETAPLILSYYNGRYGTTATMEDMLYGDLRPWGVSDQAVLVARVEEYLRSENHYNHPPKREVVAAVRHLARGFELHVVTGRSKQLENMTKNVIGNFFPGMFKSLIFTDFYHKERHSKLSVCKRLNAVMLIDDHPHHALNTAEGGVPSLLFGNYPWNRSLYTNSRVRRVADWSEVLQAVAQ